MTADTLISVSELISVQKSDDVLVVDCRFDLVNPGKGERDYRDAHVPGAVYASLDRDLSDLGKHGRGRHPLPDDAAFSASLSRWGWTRGLQVVAYDEASGALAAARLWWLLRLAGQVRVAVLDGGLAAWRTAGLPLESGEVRRTPTAVDLVFDRAQIVGFDEVERGRVDGTLALIDARAAARYRGEVEPIDAVAGHVPGAMNRPYSDNIDAAGRFKAADQLRREFAAVLAGRDADRIAHMCGSGVTACHNLLAMERAGLAGSRVFAPSWSGWISDPARPVAVGGDKD
jgi:thiosulfate/3-mercaptopyruvate sulfurtransferase